MSSDITVRAWKDPHFREELSADIRASLPTHPAGVMNHAEDIESYGGGGDMITERGCLDVLTKMFSCVGCEHTLWHGSCWASTIGCCPPVS